MTRQFQLRKWPAEVISTHILTRRMTGLSIVFTKTAEISTHILTRRMTWLRGVKMSKKIFQLTSSRGGWLLISSDTHDSISISTHILTRRMTIISYFFQFSSKHFNSHPHEEDDRAYSSIPLCQKLFQLTSSRGGWLWLLDSDFCWQHFNSHPQEEDDNKNIFLVVCWTFQLTSSRGGWHFLIGWPSCNIRISTHILTRRMTSICPSTISGWLTFQLTSSRGGWP